MSDREMWGNRVLKDRITIEKSILYHNALINKKAIPQKTIKLQPNN